MVVFILSIGCAALLLIHGAFWSAVVAAISGVVVLVRPEMGGSACLRVHDSGRCEIVGPEGFVETRLESVFSGWGFALLGLKTLEGGQTPFLATTTTLAGSEVGRFRRWLKSAPHTRTT
jgi:hypothetical protein